ncbi:MAG: hypothetical protein KBG28_16725 [Kofleriaceae bacterium]|jgi:hypothetical protein|nr:hypothetical protein [Kofleriaceae bacterium]MBP9205618.1 hypothetical protein [Kofleriaceae bacterium]
MPTATTPASPSPALLGAALAGLLGMVPGCGDSHDHAATDARRPAPDAAPADAAPAPDAAPDASPIISEVEGNRTFANVEAECDTRGGFTQVTAACSGMNSCAGFSYGDWDPGLTTEHTCAGLNGCNGISCVVLPTDGGLTGQQVYESTLTETGPRACANCHAEWDENGPDLTKFKVWLMPGVSRDASNWLNTTAKQQARMIAFGSHGLLADGGALASMQGYHKIFSKAEIERAVTYLRSAAITPVFASIKTADPMMLSGANPARRRPSRR